MISVPSDQGHLVESPMAPSRSGQGCNPLQPLLHDFPCARPRKPQRKPEAHGAAGFRASNFQRASESADLFECFAQIGVLIRRRWGTAANTIGLAYGIAGSAGAADSPAG